MCNRLITQAMLVLKYELSLFFQPKSQILLRQNVFILKVFIMINIQLLSTAIAKDFNTDYYCSDFRNESNGIFVLGVFFFHANFHFLTSHF